MQRWHRILVSVSLCAIAAMAAAWNGQAKPFAQESGFASTKKATLTAKKSANVPPTLTVLAVGGSSAQGYDDPNLNGYLSRAMAQVSNTLNEHIVFVNKAKSGQIPTMLAPTFDPIVHQVKPDIVILSWGLLNSISRKVPKAMFQHVIQSEVTMALHEGASVWIVTPPATPASYVGHDVNLLRQYAGLEIGGARAVGSPDVHVFDLMDAMEQYLAKHHLPYQPYESNNWHMNRAGHILAGKILADAILRRANAVGI